MRYPWLNCLILYSKLTTTKMTKTTTTSIETLNNGPLYLHLSLSSRHNNITLGYYVLLTWISDWLVCLIDSSMLLLFFGALWCPLGVWTGKCWWSHDSPLSIIYNYYITVRWLSYGSSSVVIMLLGNIINQWTEYETDTHTIWRHRNWVFLSYP